MYCHSVSSYTRSRTARKAKTTEIPINRVTRVDLYFTSFFIKPTLKHIINPWIRIKPSK